MGGLVAVRIASDEPSVSPNQQQPPGSRATSIDDGYDDI